MGRCRDVIRGRCRDVIRGRCRVRDMSTEQQGGSVHLLKWGNGESNGKGVMGEGGSGIANIDPDGRNADINSVGPSSRDTGAVRCDA